MLPIVLAISSMLVLILIISFLPLGITVKGKLFIVLASFLLALGGLAAVLAIPLWETVIMLVALIFFTAYFMEKQWGKLIFKEIPSFEEELADKFDIPLYDSNIDIEKSNMSLDLTELELVQPSVTNVIDNSQLDINLVREQFADTDQDISFLLERDLENDVEEQKEVLKPEIGHSTDIKSLLDEEKVDIDWLEEIDVFSSKDEEEQSFDDSSTKENVQLSDPTFDFLFARKEVAASNDDVQEENK
ncbi:hypothetical protein [Neobacillus vireti]|uniref:Uncharacterized protein n=1 Tax=Neobacillus vireti LMG 21834 TaxID=1131730 RepID=A0AB94ITI2_9BACI|nr:hypothetical protein [Neobacillus vireti]ETI70298.1 hypothetical protein BAVI_03114 [Neobacillus vireti LMG 21834]KLT16831.1 hypothetical protein AA980_13020 [Neobacillus vireti]